MPEPYKIPPEALALLRMAYQRSVAAKEQFEFACVVVARTLGIEGNVTYDLDNGWIRHADSDSERNASQLPT